MVELIGAEVEWFEQESPPVIPGETARIYHYTTLETLEKILMNRTLRFTRLDHLDDAMEVKTFPGTLARNFYVSCWTIDPSDTPMAWRRFYSDSSDARDRIRISISKKPFPYHSPGGYDKYGVQHTAREMAQPFCLLGRYTESYSLYDGNFHQQDWFGRRVTYIENVERFYNDRLIFHADGGLEVQRLMDFATHKEAGWDEQMEYRFVICAMPPLPIPRGDPATLGFVAREVMTSFWYRDAMRGGMHPAAPFIDLPLSVESISDLEVTMAPTFLGDNFPRLSTLLSKHVPTASLSNSRFSGKMLR